MGTGFQLKTGESREYDKESLIFHFKEAGFGDVKEYVFQERLNDHIEIIEKAERVLDNEGVCFEGIK